MGISLRYAGFITSLGILKGTVDINFKNLEKCKIGLLLSDCSFEIRVEKATSV